MREIVPPCQGEFRAFCTFKKIVRTVDREFCARFRGQIGGTNTMDEEAKDKGTEVIIAAVKVGMAAAGMVAGGPLAALGAGLAAELVSVVVPNYKQERYEKWVYELERRVEALEGEQRERAQQRVSSPEFADLFEDATRQAVRSLSEDRIKQLSNLLLSGLTDMEMDHARRKRLLDLFSQINDVEVLLLQGLALYPGDSHEFWEQHPELFPEPFYFGSSQETVDKGIVFESYRRHLTDLWLLKSRYQKPMSNKPVEFDFNTGSIKSSGHEVTGLGRLLLHEIGLREPMRQKYRQEA
jgi:hypothetical protein